MTLKAATKMIIKYYQKIFMKKNFKDKQDTQTENVTV